MRIPQTFTLLECTFPIALPNGKSVEVDLIDAQVAWERHEGKDFESYWSDYADWFKGQYGVELSKGQTWQLLKAVDALFPAFKKKFDEGLKSLCSMDGIGEPLMTESTLSSGTSNHPFEPVEN